MTFRSTGGQHFNVIWKRLEELQKQGKQDIAQDFWQTWELILGTLALNHLTGDLIAKRRPFEPGLLVNRPQELPEAEKWFKVCSPAGSKFQPEKDPQNWQDAWSSVCAGHRCWRETMERPAARLADVLEANGLADHPCGICGQQLYEQAVRGPAHYKALYSLYNLPADRERRWQLWHLSNGQIMFDHLTGEIRMKRSAGAPLPFSQRAPAPMPLNSGQAFYPSFQAPGQPGQPQPSPYHTQQQPPQYAPAAAPFQQPLHQSQPQQTSPFHMPPQQPSQQTPAAPPFQQPTQQSQAQPQQPSPLHTAPQQPPQQSAAAPPFQPAHTQQPSPLHTAPRQPPQQSAAAPPFQPAHAPPQQPPQQATTAPPFQQPPQEAEAAAGPFQPPQQTSPFHGPPRQQTVAEANFRQPPHPSQQAEACTAPFQTPAQCQQTSPLQTPPQQKAETSPCPSAPEREARQEPPNCEKLAPPKDHLAPAAPIALGPEKPQPMPLGVPLPMEPQPSSLLQARYRLQAVVGQQVPIFYEYENPDTGARWWWNEETEEACAAPPVPPVIILPGHCCGKF
eukprot:s413_g7.t2